MCQRSAHSELGFVQGMVAAFPEFLLLDFKAGADEETIEDLVQLDIVVWLSMV